MKKMFLVIMLCISVLCVVSCDDLEVMDIDRLGIEGLSFLTYFREGEQILLDDVKVVAYTSESTEPIQTLSIDSELIDLEGNGFVEIGDHLYLNTETADEEYTLTVSYGGISVTLKYTVVDDYVLVGQSHRADYPTITSALAEAPVNTTIVVEPGTYPENVVISTQGIQLMASGNVILDSGAIESAQDYGVVIAADNVVFDGFTIRNTAAAIVVQGAADVTVSNNTVTGLNYNGIAVLQNSDRIIIESNTLNQILQYGIVIGYNIVVGANPEVTTTGSVIRSNTVNGAGASAIYADIYSNHNQYVDNVLTHAVIGIHLYKSNNDLVQNNTITYQSGNGIELMGSNDNLIKDNHILNNAGYGILISLSTGTGDPTPNGNNDFTGNDIYHNNLDVLTFGPQIYEEFATTLNLLDYVRNSESNNDFGTHADPIDSGFLPDNPNYAMLSE